MTYNNENEANDARVCRNCGAPIKEGYLFCIKCGTKYELRNVCPGCNYENREEMLFCIKCGMSLTGGLAPAYASPASAPAPAYTPPAATPAYMPPMAVPSSKIVCPSCMYENNDGMLFCIKCGTRLTNQYAPAPVYTPPAAAPSRKFICPSCRHENNEGMLFCIKCGTRLINQYAPAPAYVPPTPVYAPAAPAYVPPAPAYAPSAPAASQLRRITIRRESQFVCAANSYKVIVNGSPLGNIPVGRTIIAPVDTEVADVEIICTTIMINKKLRMKLRLGANPVVSFTVQWPGDIFESVQDAQILEKSN